MVLLAGIGVRGSRTSENNSSRTYITGANVEAGESTDIVPKSYEHLCKSTYPAAEPVRTTTIKATIPLGLVNEGVGHTNETISPDLAHR